jgi:hypothetical protein
VTLSRKDTILAATGVDFLAATKRFILSRSPATTNPDLDYILGLYRESCLKGGVELELCLTQMVHETDSLRSAWSQPPKRNMAGIGVTGGVDTTTGEPLGQWFPTWLDAVQSHVGLLLAYRLAAADGTAAQKQLISVITGYRGSLTGLRGIATNIEEMAVKWAADAVYADKLVDLSALISRS